MLNRKWMCIYLLFGACLLSGCTAMIAGGTATGIMVAQDRRTTGTIVEDKSIELKAKKLIHDIISEKDNIHVVVTSYNNHILLLGQTQTAELRDKVEYAVRHIPKVEKVYNEITVAAPTSVMARANDSWVTTKIKTDMVVKRRMNPTRVRVVTEDGVVYLMGIIDKQEEETAVDIARHTKGVKKVVKIFEYLPG